MNAVALVADLIFASRVTGAAGPGATVRVVRTPEALAEALADGADLALIDLEADGAHEAIARCAAARPRPRTVAFGSHVRRDALEQARAAGADEALPRSAFVARLPALLSPSVPQEPKEPSAAQPRPGGE